MESDNTVTSLEQNRRGLSWFLFFRLLVATLFLGGTIVYQWRSSSFTYPQVPFFYLLIALTYLQTIISVLLLPTVIRLRLFAQAQIVWDLLLATAIIYLTGGHESQFSFLYILIIFSSSIFLPRRDILFVASAASILFGSLLDLQYFGRLPALGDYSPPRLPDGGQVLYAVFLNVSAFFLVGLLSSQLVERGRRSEQALEKKEIDYEELEKLNRTIVSNINSGLMLINASGRIRSYNDAAQRITGYTLEEVYDRDVRDIFDRFGVYRSGDFNVVKRGQGLIVAKDGKGRTLGYSTTLVKDADDRTIGLLVVFQDLTDLIEMEEELRRADRLAAVGRLASGMAHEIRNPLASISGSVQLLMENNEIGKEDRRLMGIVVSEADRLGKLLTDFLAFAKPAKPEVVTFNLSDLLDDLIAMLNADRRFKDIDIVRDYDPDREIHADPRLLHQVLLDLAINATEAMSGKGRLSIGMEPSGPIIYIEDTGPGISESDRDKIFEPFFTTKDSGTGLGLATVYSIIEAHGGQIEVTSGRESGARFSLLLPKKPGRDLQQERLTG